MKKSTINKENVKKTIITILLVFVGYILQTTLLQHMQVADVSPNLMLVLVVFIAYVNNVYVGMATGMACGFLIDCQYGAVIGMCMLAYVIIGYFCGVLNRVYYKGDYLIPLGMVAISELIYSVVIYVMDFLLRGRLDIGFYIRKVVLPEMVYTLLIAVFVYGIVCKLYKSKEDKGGNVL
ncbi:MAG: rod shape-determining protein MreD [Lachnospiraceae bacterium]|nr:rod shape-determining protein MreD [Lachnospiraceae bacterium]